MSEAEQLCVSDASEDSEPGIEEVDRSKRSPRPQFHSACRSLCRAPPATALVATRPKWLLPTTKLPPFSGNPNYGPVMQLFCRTGYNVALFPDKRVRGIDVDRHPNAVLEFTSVNLGEVRMKGIATGLYLAMNSEGHLYGEIDSLSPQAVFVEYLFGKYNVFLSKHWAHLGWYAAIKKSGKVKPGKQTRWGQKAIQFLPIRVNA